MKWMRGGKDQRGVIGVILECPHEETLLQHAAGLVGEIVEVTVGDCVFEGKFRRATATTKPQLEIVPASGDDPGSETRHLDLILSMKVTLAYTEEMNRAIGAHLGQGLEPIGVRPLQRDMFGGDPGDGGEAQEAQ
jgi:hypothetical protein